MNGEFRIKGHHLWIWSMQFRRNRRNVFPQRTVNLSNSLPYKVENVKSLNILKKGYFCLISVYFTLDLIHIVDIDCEQLGLSSNPSST